MVALQICSCMLVWFSPPRPQIPRSHPPPPEAGWTTVSCWCTGFSSYLCVPSSTHLQMPCPAQPVCHVFCTALCECHVHSVDTSLCSPISPSHICIVSLCDLDLPPFFPTLLRQQDFFFFSRQSSKSSVNWAVDVRKQNAGYFVPSWVLFSLLSTSIAQLSCNGDEIHLTSFLVFQSGTGNTCKGFIILAKTSTNQEAHRFCQTGARLKHQKYTASSGGCRQPVSLFLICMTSSCTLFLYCIPSLNCSSWVVFFPPPSVYFCFTVIFTHPICLHSHGCSCFKTSQFTPTHDITDTPPPPWSTSVHAKLNRNKTMTQTCNAKWGFRAFAVSICIFWFKKKRLNEGESAGWWFSGSVPKLKSNIPL